jgi:hypothetical protein
MDLTDFGVILAMQTPVYYALWDIQRRIGTYDQLCIEVSRLRNQHDAVMSSGGHR